MEQRNFDKKSFFIVAVYFAIVFITAYFIIKNSAIYDKQ